MDEFSSGGGRGGEAANPRLGCEAGRLQNLPRPKVFLKNAKNPYFLNKNSANNHHSTQNLLI